MAVRVAAAAAALWLAAAVALSSAECLGGVCDCRWKGGKQTVECIGKGLLTIPAAMDSSTQVLDFSGNNIQILARHKFQRMGLINLQRIYLARCKLSQVNDHALFGLTNLVELDLSDNLLTDVPGRTFTDVPALMRLSLSGNPIRRLSRTSLTGLRELTSLELSRCELETVEEDAFAALTKLQWLRLDGNRLATMQPDGLSLGLHGVDLHANPWRCDCRLRPLRRWLVLYKVPPAVVPRCSEPPRLAGRPLRDTEPPELACLPEVTTDQWLIEVAEHQNVTLNCRVHAEPPANVSWSFNDQPLSDSDAVFYRPYAISEYSEQAGTLRHGQLLVLNATDTDEGVFRCTATNVAGVSSVNYTLRVLLPPGSSSSESAPPQRPTYLAAVGASLALLLALLALLVCLVALRCARRRRQRPPVEADAKTGVINTAVDTPSSTCSAPKAVGAAGAGAGRPPPGGLADCREHVTYIGQRCCTSPSRRSADSNPDVVSDTEPTARRADRHSEGDFTYERRRSSKRLGALWRPDEPAPLVHVDVHPGPEPRRSGTVGRSRSYHQQLAGVPPAGYRSLPRHRPHGRPAEPPAAELLQMQSVSISNRPPPPPPPPRSTRPVAVAEAVPPLQGGLPSPPGLDSPPPLAPPAGFTDDEVPTYSQVRRPPRGDPNTSGLPAPPPAGPAVKFGDHVTAAHSSLHESPDEGYDESAGDVTEV
ncbi:leucine-rich repeat-containing protein 24-like [Amphibalanus amphitrite]|uniref:leucine-rich repeat-containing protein 24-like n=1 Tax=Amphibalanus amphitrite TaxID=1232801 RepID=UPI001C92A37E|nr:leucine-rich repeat-containing protein 24-like [Amphibalanus amphitrite]